MAMERMERPRGSVAAKLRNPFVTLVVLALLIVGGVPVYISRQAQAREIFRIQRRTAEQIAFPISTYLQSARRDLSLFAQTRNLAAMERSEQQSAIEQLWAQRQDIYDEITLVDRAGDEVAKVSRFHTFLPAELGNQVNAAAFQQAVSGREYLADEVVISPYSGLPVTEMAVPVREPGEGDIVGVLMAKVSIKRMWDVVAEVEVGETGYAYVIDTAGHLLAHTDLSRYLQLQTQDISHVPVVQTVLQGLAGPTQAREYTGLEGAKVVGAHTLIGGTSWFAVAELPTKEAYASVQQIMLSLLGFLSVAVLIIGAVSSWLPRRIIRPLEKLEEGAALLGSGQLDHRITVRTGDELEALANAFNSMAAQLRELIENLEQRVADRTRGLQTAAEVAHATTSVLDPDELLRQVVDLARERFDLYYVGLFLLDEERQFAVLRAGTGQAGRQMLAQGHRLEVGGASMIGWCVANAEARIALDVGEEAVRFDNPLLPETRSEMALPLRSRGRVVGAMTVQSVQEAAFDEAGIAVMQTMADQVAVAIDNARLFAETQAALGEMEAIHRRYLGRAWGEYAQTAKTTGYETDYPGAVPLGDTVLSEIRQAVERRGVIALASNGDEAQSSRRIEGEPPSRAVGGESRSALVAPIALRGEVIGVLGIHDEDGGRQWSDDEIALVEAITERMALAAESLRLFDETQRRAERERLTGQVTARMRETLDVETVLKTAVREVRQALGLPEVVVRLATNPAGEAKKGDK